MELLDRVIERLIKLTHDKREFLFEFVTMEWGRQNTQNKSTEKYLSTSKKYTSVTF